VTAAAEARPSSGRQGVEPAILAWCGAFLFTAACLLLKEQLPWVVTFPKEWTLPLAKGINAVADVTVPLAQPYFRAFAATLESPMRGIRLTLEWLPWPAVMLAITILALNLGGLRLALFALFTLFYMFLVGYWPQSMNTLSLVMLAVPISAAIGFSLGVFGHRSPTFRSFLQPALDLMQTMPAFAYLIPLLLLFGFGPVVGLIASTIYATPPMVRNTLLGLARVPSDIREAGIMCGCTRRQHFWGVEVPTALPQILVGLNQTTMAALSMVIIAAIIGGFQDIGWEVLSSMRKAEFGQSILSGLVIALLAILIDRMTLALAKGRPGGPTRIMTWLTRERMLIALCMAAGLALLLRVVWPQGLPMPGAEVRLQASVLNQWLLGVVRDYATVFNGIRNGALYGLVLPLRVGISGSATPYIWGFSLTPMMIAAYAALIALLSGWLLRRLGWRAAAATILAGVFLYYGFLGFPWPAFILIAGLVTWQVSGPRLAAFAVAGFGIILLSGLWVPLMQSLYLCTLAVTLCMLIGGAIGVWAAHNDTVSGIVRPINDALQTMPQFVFLIPALMFFKVGEFTALIAVMLYAIVPPIRYVEHGMRHLRADVVEAARQMGASPFQMLRDVKLPLSLPVVMLGLNQTIMAGLSMLAIAALVGTRDLGQQVYVALGKADAGMGLIAGLAIAFLAIVSDRTIQAWLGGPGEPAQR